MSDETETHGQKVVDLFSACIADPDDGSVAGLADEALWELERLLVAPGTPGRTAT